MLMLLSILVRSKMKPGAFDGYQPPSVALAEQLYDEDDVEEAVSQTERRLQVLKLAAQAGGEVG